MNFMVSLLSGSIISEKAEICSGDQPLVEDIVPFFGVVAVIAEWRARGADS